MKFRSDGITGSGAYNAAVKLNILDKLFEKNDQPIWTKEMCAEAASKCKTVSEFYIKYPNEAYAAKRRKWMADITKHMPRWNKTNKKQEERIYVIYVYEEINTHSAYVGLTNNITRRDKQHRLFKDKNDTL